MGLKKNLDKISFEKKCYVEKKTFCPKTYLDLIKILCPKKILGPKKFWVKKKVLGQKKIFWQTPPICVTIRFLCSVIVDFGGVLLVLLVTWLILTPRPLTP